MEQYELADKAGLSMGYLCHLEKGSRDNPSIEICKKISIALNENLENLFGQ